MNKKTNKIHSEKDESINEYADKKKELNDLLNGLFASMNVAETFDDSTDNEYSD